jgi:hypothetical protein
MSQEEDRQLEEGQEEGTCGNNEAEGAASAPKFSVSNVTRVEDRIIGFLNKLEIRMFKIIRSDGFPLLLYTVAMCLACCSVPWLPLLETRTASFGIAWGICSDRHKNVADEHAGAQNSPDGDKIWRNTHYTYNSEFTFLARNHWLSAAVLLVSLSVHLWWLFGSPHRLATAPEARHLDRKLGSFFGVQLLADFVIATIGPLSYCSGSVPVYRIFNVLGMTMKAMVSMQATNLLSHRYLIERAQIMTTAIAEGGQDEGWLSLKNLDAAIIWEVRIMVSAGICAMSYFFDERLASGLAAVVTVPLVCADLIFSVVITYKFLEPLLSTLKVTKNIDSVARQRLQRTKRLNVMGVAVLTVCSSLLYSNAFIVLLKGAFGDVSWWKSFWLNQMVS